MSDSERITREAKEAQEQRAKERESYSQEARALYDKGQQLREGWMELTNVELVLGSAISWLKRFRSKEPDGSDLAIAIDSLGPLLDAKFSKVHEECTRLVEASHATQQALTLQLREERISRLKPEHQERGRELLEQMDHETEAVQQPIEAGKFGGFGGTVFGLEIRLKRAEEEGNTAEIASINRALEVARPAMHEGERLMHGYRQQIEDIRAKYERMLVELEPIGD